MGSTKTKPFVVTLAWLERTGACAEQRTLFKRKFPKGSVEITRVNHCRLAESDFSIDWLAGRLLTTEEYNDTLREVYASTLGLDAAIQIVWRKHHCTRKGTFRSRVDYEAYKAEVVPLRELREQVARERWLLLLLENPRRKSSSIVRRKAR